MGAATKTRRPRLKVVFFLSLIFFLGTFLRLLFLGQIPFSLNWDEVAIGYNAYSLLKTGKDEFGTRLPLFLRSFGDYKSALPAYLAIPFIKYLGLNSLSIRLPTAIFSSLTILACFFLVLNLSKNISLSLISTFLFSLSAWALHFSHFSHEGTLAFCFMLWGLVFWFKSKKNALSMLFASLFFSLSLYAYHNVRLFLPLFLIVTLILEGKKSFKKNLKAYLIFGLSLIVFLIPLFVNLIKGNLAPRVKEVSIFHTIKASEEIMEGFFRYTALGVPFKRVINNKLSFFTYTFLTKYLEHFSLDFLFLGKDISPRLGVENVGRLHLFTLPFLVYGLLKLAFTKNKKFAYILFAWIGLAPLASSLTWDSPHALRSLIFLPTFQILTAYGFLEIFKLIRLKKGIMLAKVFSVLCLSLFLLNFSYFFHHYYFYYPEHSAIHWQDGYQKMVDFVWPLKDKYNQVIVTKHLGQPHVFFAFWGKKDPVDYQRQRQEQSDFDSLNATLGKLDNIEFKDIEAEKEICYQNSLLIGKPEAFKGLVDPTKTIYFTNRFGKKEPVFDIAETDRYATLSAKLKKKDVCKKI